MIRAENPSKGRVISKYAAQKSVTAASGFSPEAETVKKAALESYSKATGWSLGMKHGEEEIAKKRGSPGALKLAVLRLLHGNSYVLGRQHALTRSGMHGGTGGGTPALEAVGTVLRELLAETK